MTKGMRAVTGVGLFFVLGFLWPQIGFAQLGDFLKKKGAPKVDVDGLSSRAEAVKNLVQKATISFAEAVVDIQEASGKKEQAEKMKQNIANAKSKPGQENLKVLMRGVNEGVADIEKSNSLAQVSDADAKKVMGTSILKVGVGVVLDGTATKNASVLVKDAQEALKQAPVTSVGKIKDVIDVGQFVMQEVPPQVTSMDAFSATLIAYAKTKGAPYPSPEEIAQKAKEKE
jgi:hypothetical protein